MKKSVKHLVMWPEGPQEALLNTTTTLNVDRDDSVAQAIGEMTPTERERLELFARSAGLTPEQAMVKIICLVLHTEGR